jgi:hypothetical protein
LTYIHKMEIKEEKEKEKEKERIKADVKELYFFYP